MHNSNQEIFLKVLFTITFGTINFKVIKIIINFLFIRLEKNIYYIKIGF